MPRELLALVGAGRWRCPADRVGIDQLFPERGQFCLYSFGLMESETQAFLRPGEQSPMWLGAPDPAHPPGDIDPGMAALIADLGIGYDQPIALDYRPSLDRPRVLTLSWLKPDPGSGLRYKNRWVEIAPTIEAFAALAGL